MIIMGTKLNEFIKEWTPRINQVLESKIEQDTDQQKLFESMSYSVNAGGKRLRPLLTIATLITFNQAITDSILKATCALELLHSYSLIHDDLPAMDNDGLRRGKPTNHTIYGAGMATLAGDGLQALAFQWVVDNDLTADTRCQLALALAKAAGPRGMASGQADDIEFEGTRLKLHELQKLDRNKTGALISYAVNAGLIMAQVPKDQKKDLLAFANNFGAAFQIYDDILDIVGDEKAIGKPVHQDADKNTYPNLMGLDGAYEALQRTVDRARHALNTAGHELNIDTSLLLDFCSYFVIKDERHNGKTTR